MEESIDPRIYRDKADEDIMIFWSRDKLDEYFTKMNQSERARRQQFRKKLAKGRSSCASVKFFI